MVPRTAEIIGIGIYRDVEIHLILRDSLHNITHRPDTCINAYLIDNTIKVIQIEHTRHHRIIHTLADNQVFLTNRGIIHTPCSCHFHAIVVKVDFLIITVNGRYQVMPLVPP